MEITKCDVCGKIKKEFNKLGRMVKRGFDDIDNEFKKVKNDLSEIKNDLGEIKEGHEAIESRLGNLALKFEVNDLNKRVGKLELKHA